MDLTGVTALVVEDECLVALDVGDTLAEAGATVVEIAASCVIFHLQFFEFRAWSTLQGPGPAKTRYRNTKQNSIAASPPLLVGKRSRGACAIQ